MALIKIISTGGTIANTSHGLIGVDDLLVESRGSISFDTEGA